MIHVPDKAHAIIARRFFADRTGENSLELARCRGTQTCCVLTIMLQRLGNGICGLTSANSKFLNI
jgi:hypothetical protein